MEILIEDNSSLYQIQEEFNNHFPYLKLEFFEFDPTENTFSKKNLITDTNKTLGEIRHVHISGHISMNSHQKASTLEQHFKDFGINVQVFRKSANIWLQTTTTDHWTLSEQNKKGEEMNHTVTEEIPYAEDVL